ncbi:MAG: sensory box protein [Chlamydiales bacterium]|jgi:predicted transcriptional regulator YheO|nr:sensory box protein [Chlamydiales bacterium]
MKPSLKNALPFAEAFARLLHPFAEVVVHDLELDQIAAIYNPLSRREVGDPSYLDRIQFDAEASVIGPYEKMNWDGRKMKSISVLIYSAAGHVEGFLCVNTDISAFAFLKEVLGQFLSCSIEIPESTQKIFSEDLYEKINIYVQNYCRERNLALAALSREEKRELIEALAEQGAFKERNAATYIGRVLAISRATVYNYLKEREALGN